MTGYMPWVLVMCGGFAGAIGRYLISRLLNKNGTRFPVGTFVINSAGSFLLGIIANYGEPWVVYTFGTGFMGAFTTFSTLQVEQVQLWKRGMGAAAVRYMALTYGCGIGLAWLGYLAGQWITI